MSTILTGADYPDLCQNCRTSIDNAYELIQLGLGDDYSLDPEGPCMFAYDKRWLCDDDCPEAS